MEKCRYKATCTLDFRRSTDRKLVRKIAERDACDGCDVGLDRSGRVAR